MLLEFVLLLVALVIIWDTWMKKRRNEVLSYMTGPRTIPVVGNVWLYHGLKPEEIMPAIFANRHKYGRIYRVWILNQLGIFSCDPNDVEVVLSSPIHIAKNNLYALLYTWLGGGLLMSTGQKWHQRRKIITPTFHFKILEEFVHVFDSHSGEMVRRLYDQADGQTAINIFPAVCKATLDIIMETAMGTKLNTATHSQLSYVQAVSIVTDIIARRYTNVWQRINWVFWLTNPSEARLLAENIRLMHDFTERIIMKRRQSLIESLSQKEPSAEQAENEDIGIRRPLALLDILLQSSIDGHPLSNADIREEVDTFMFEGHDTTTSGISFALYTIARHPEVQQKLYEEICTVLGEDRDRPVTLHDLTELKYMECVIKESMRLYPPVPIIGRYINEDLEINGKLIPAGTNLFIGIFVLLREPEYYPDPGAFKPERFLDMATDSIKQSPFAYIPFSAGPRNCVGQKFAMLEMKCVISKMLRHFELLPLGPDVRPVINLILRSSSGNHIGLKHRKGNNSKF